MRPAAREHPAPLTVPAQLGRATAVGPRTVLDKVWDAHVVDQFPDGSDLLYVDCHLVQEVSSPQAFSGLAVRGRRVRRPDLTVATMDHNVPTTPGRGPLDELAERQTATLAASCAAEGIACYGLDSDRQGIVHVIGPELGLSQPGMTIVCGDSHTCTHGALGALAFGIGTSEVEQVLATQCIVQRRPRRLCIELVGRLATGVGPKDLALAMIASLGNGSAAGYAIEYTGSAVGALSMEARMTLCNMSVEAGAKIGMIGPDETTFAYLQDRDYVRRLPVDYHELVASWSLLRTDEGAEFDRVEHLDAALVEPMVTWGTTPAMAVPVGGAVPDPADTPDPDASARALGYMGLHAGQALAELTVDTVFVGSCTNGRIEDLRQAAAVLSGRRIAPGLRALVVPGSTAVRRQAEHEGLHEVFLGAGAEWREAGCSMCVAINDDRLAPGERCVSTSNRNFQGRQGPGGRTHLASPATAAAAAVAGHLVDVRTWELPPRLSRVRGRRG